VLMEDRCAQRPEFRAGAPARQSLSAAIPAARGRARRS
jgi:hypothetical protein